jgi:hypothetical protein
MPFRYLPDFGRRLPDSEPWRFTLLEPQHGLEAGDYVFLESYCDEKGCDCRRVWLTVVHRKPGAAPDDFSGPVATIGYGWEQPDFYENWSPNDPEARFLAGARLEPFQRQGKQAEAVLHMTVSAILRPAANRERIRRHYDAARSAVAAGKVRSRRGLSF